MEPRRSGQSQKSNDPGKCIGEIVELKVKVARLETEISWIKDKVRGIDNKLWALIAMAMASALGLIINILLRVMA